MLDRFELFQKLLLVVVAKVPVDWKTAIGWMEDIQDSNVIYMIRHGEDESVAKKLTDYVNWKLGLASRPFWFVKAGE